MSAREPLGGLLHRANSKRSVAKPTRSGHDQSDTHDPWRTCRDFCLITSSARTSNNVGGTQRPRALTGSRVSLWLTFSAMQFSGSPCGDWAWGLQWTAPPFTNSSRKSAARRPRSQRPSKKSPRSRLNWLSKSTEPNSTPLCKGRYGPYQSVLTADGCWQQTRIRKSVRRGAKRLQGRPANESRCALRMDGSGSPFRGLVTRVRSNQLFGLG
jgi:hypothetical protein